MGRISKEDIVGLSVPSGLYCVNCWSNEMYADMEADQIITQDDIENSEDYYFCDGCSKSIPT